MSKRAEMRDRRRRAQSRRRLTFVGVVAVAALVLIAAIVYPSLTPVGDFVVPNPEPRGAVDGRQLGEAEAPVLIELYEDFQCPACAQFTEVIGPSLIENFVATGKARLVYRHYAFIGQESLQAASASMCAEDQGRFWDYHDILFANQSGENLGAFRDRRLLAFAEALGLDMQAFERCFNRGEHRDAVDQERADGFALGVNSTPTIVLNGTIFQGPDPGTIPSYEVIAAAIEALLAPESGTP